MPTLCRLEYLTPNGWTVGHAGIALIDPHRYVERLTDRNKFGRATELDENLQPSGKVWVSPNLPTDLSVLVPDPPYRVPKLPVAKADGTCPVCDEAHPEPYDGSCLL